MKKLFSSQRLKIFIPVFLTLLFFILSLLAGKIPIPADTLLGLYHPFRDESFSGYTAYKFPIKNPLITDPMLQTYPWRNLIIENFKNAKLPFWNPYNFSGQPLLANSQASPFQITNILFFILPFKFAWGIQIILPALLTSLFMYLFLKSLKLSSAPAVFGSIVLPFSGFFVAWLTWGTVITTAMWLPLILFSINKLFEKTSALIYLLLIFALSQSILSGHLQTALYVFATCFLYTFYKLLKSASIKSALIITSGLLLAISVSSFQLIPTLEFVSLSSRNTDQDYTPVRQYWFMPRQHLIQLVAPDYFGNPTTYNYWGIWNWAEFAGYIGILPLFFAGIALIGREKKVSFFIILTFVSLILCLANPLSKLPYTHNLPFISSMQPSRIIYLMTFSLTVISAVGLDLFLKNKIKRKYIILLILLIFIILAILLVTITQKRLFPIIENLDPTSIALRNLVLPIVLTLSILGLIIFKFIKIPKPLLIVVIFLITLIDLFRFAYKFTPFSKLSLIFPPTKTTSYLASQTKPFRIMTTDRRIFPPNSNIVYKIESVNGYDPLFLKDYAKLVSSWGSQKVEEPGSFNRIVTPKNYQSQVADFLNVKYLLSFDEISNPKMTKVFEEGETKIYENKSVLPRAYFATEVIKVDSLDQQLEKILDSDFDLKNSAFSTEFSYEKQQNQSMVNFDNYSDQNFSLKVFTQNQAPLIVSNPFYAGWQAFIDGQKTNIYKVDFMFQSILVPQGNHTVEFNFHPQSFYNGFYISILGLLASFFITITIWRKKYL